MGSGFLSLSAWVRPFGFVREERASESKLGLGEDESDLVLYAVLAILDVLTLPLAVLLVAGIGRADNSSGTT